MQIVNHYNTYKISQKRLLLAYMRLFFSCFLVTISWCTLKDKKLIHN